MLCYVMLRGLLVDTNWVSGSKTVLFRTEIDFAEIQSPKGH